MSLQRNVAQKTTTVHYDWSLLHNRDLRDKYTLTLRNKFNALQEISETQILNDEYENFVNAHLEAEVECIPTKQRAKPRVPREMLAVRKKECRWNTPRIVNNYRGITLTSIAAKIYNTLLYNCTEPEIQKILRKNQNGFQKNRSTTSQI